MLETIFTSGVAGIFSSLLFICPILLIWLWNKSGKKVFVKALENPSKVKIKDNIFIKRVNDEAAINIIEEVLLERKIPIITDDIVRSMYSISPCYAKKYSKFIGEKTEVAVKHMRDSV